MRGYAQPSTRVADYRVMAQRLENEKKVGEDLRKQLDKANERIDMLLKKGEG